MPERQGELFRKFIENKGISDAEAGRILGVSSEQVSKYYESNRFQRPTFTKIQQKFPDFILKDSDKVEYNNNQNGESFSLKSPDYPDNQQTANNNSTGNIQVIKPNGGVVAVKQNRKKGDALIPFYNADFMAGNAEVYYEDNTIYPEYYMDIPEFSGCIAFRAQSDSMYPKIRPGTILFGNKLSDWNTHLEFGQIYGITCTDGRRYLKYIRRDQENPKTFFLLKSENPEYDDFEIPKQAIKNIWLIEGWLNKST